MVSIADKECEGSRVRGSHGVVFPRRDHKVFVFNVWSGQFHPQYRRNGLRDIYAKWTLHRWCRSVTLHAVSRILYVSETICLPFIVM